MSTKVSHEEARDIIRIAWEGAFAGERFEKMMRYIAQQQASESADTVSRAEHERLLQMQRDEMNEWIGRAGEAERAVEAAQRRLACVADDMTEHAYQELASALEAPPRVADYERMREAEKNRIVDEWKAANGYNDLLAAHSASVSEADRLRKLFDDAGQGEHNVLALIDHYQLNSMEADERIRAVEAQLTSLQAEHERALAQAREDWDRDAAFTLRSAAERVREIEEALSLFRSGHEERVAGLKTQLTSLQAELATEKAAVSCYMADLEKLQAEHERVVGERDEALARYRHWEENAAQRRHEARLLAAERDALKQRVEALAKKRGYWLDSFERWKRNDLTTEEFEGLFYEALTPASPSPAVGELVLPGQCGRLLVDGQTTCGRCVLPAHDGGACQLYPAVGEEPASPPPQVAQAAEDWSNVESGPFNGPEYSLAKHPPQPAPQVVDDPWEASADAMALEAETAIEESREPTQPAPGEPEPVCKRCNDTHYVEVEDRGRQMCTACPTPCQKCRAGGKGAYCGTTPCACDCHRKPDPTPAEPQGGPEQAGASFERSLRLFRERAAKVLLDQPDSVAPLVLLTTELAMVVELLAVELERRRA